MDKSEMIRAVAREHHIEEVGVCAYNEQKRPLLPCRAAARLPQDARSVIVCLFPYAFEDDRLRQISRYACVPDYHTTAGAVLADVCRAMAQAFPDERFEAFMDNSPLREVDHAVAAGLGVKGDNGLLINGTFGSYVFIGCIVTTAALPATEATGECLHCGECYRHCHGGCLPSAKRDTCVSALTQKKGALTEEEARLIKNSGSLWGCDACQDCCPMNRGKRKSPHPCFEWYDPCLSLDNLEGKAYAWRGRAVPERNAALFSSP